ncbi:outer membrane beta-barrel protein [Chryseobacterium caseinilyticum]|uniref:Outer membrane beta-barrel protein n=1 Tax=Chryseobacterium caseinilyticum TaxID=2771428 RepID=A0ABR8Z9V8_9FLAO|nr:outer membrane beta-barrel protein [Chryseobacterium caseinilyticum]MBD8082082.1 outer membrane beta-barrel protein [Chryseobacterium caseinilyticum]
MLQKVLVFLFILTLNFVFAQRKKVDTVYVYEKVIVYDTVFVEKAIPLKRAGILLPLLKIHAKEIRSINKNVDQEKLKEEIEKIANRKFKYGILAGIGFKNASWSENISDKNQQFGQNLGIWVSKSILDPQLSLMLSANVNYWNSSFDLDANNDETYLNGFYFSEDDQPLLFQRFNNKHFEYNLQLKALYEWKNFRPFAGIVLNKNIYKMQFLVPENNVLSKLDDFKTNKIHAGFSLGLQYRILNRFLLELEYQQFKINNLSLKNSAFDFDIFKTNNTFAERKLGLGISYFISK